MHPSHLEALATGQWGSDPTHCAQRGAMDTSQEKVSGLGGRTDCGRVVALGPILALILFTWPQSCWCRATEEAG